MKTVNVYYTDSLTSALKLMSVLEDREWEIGDKKKKQVKWTRDIEELSDKHKYAKCCFTSDHIFFLDKEDKELLKNNEEFKNILIWEYIIIDIEED